jgi:hypothetical protein
MGIDKHLRILLGCILVIACDAARAIDIEIVPAQPSYFEPVHLKMIFPMGFFSSQRYLRDARVRMSGTTIFVDALVYPEIMGPATTHHVFLGRLPAGTYTVKVFTNGSLEQVAPFTDLSTQFTVGSRPGSDLRELARGEYPVADLNGLWSVPEEPGWGVSFATGPTIDLVATWFTFDSSGQPEWYSLQPGRWGGDSFTGTVYRVSGPRIAGVSRASAIEVGTGLVIVLDADHVLFSVTVDGVKTSRIVTRMKFE